MTGLQRRGASADVLLPVRLPELLREHVQVLAAAEGCRVQDVIVEAIERALAQPGCRRGIPGRSLRIAGQRTRTSHRGTSPQ